MRVFFTGILLLFLLGAADEREYTSMKEALAETSSVYALKLEDVSDMPVQIAMLENLERIYLLRTEIEELPPEFYSLKELRSVKFISNINLDLKSFFSRIDSFPELESIFVKQDMTSFPEELCGRNDIKMIRFYKCGINSLPECIMRMRNLEELRLGFNNISVLPDEIGTLKNLRVLDLENNKLTTLPDTLRNLRNLEELNLADNSINELPQPIFKMGHLKKISIGGNGFGPDVIRRLKISLRNTEVEW